MMMEVFWEKVPSPIYTASYSTDLNPQFINCYINHLYSLTTSYLSDPNIFFNPWFPNRQVQLSYKRMRRYSSHSVPYGKLHDVMIKVILGKEFCTNVCLINSNLTLL
jgi:hypothetical protein